jgi:hypothetical protein
MCGILILLSINPMEMLINFDTNKKKFIFIIIESKRRILKKKFITFHFNIFKSRNQKILNEN